MEVVVEEDLVNWGQDGVSQGTKAFLCWASEGHRGSWDRWLVWGHQRGGCHCSEEVIGLEAPRMSGCI